jgi:hypothetical protein
VNRATKRDLTDNVEPEGIGAVCTADTPQLSHRFIEVVMAMQQVDVTTVPSGRQANQHAGASLQNPLRIWRGEHPRKEDLNERLSTDLASGSSQRVS